MIKWDPRDFIEKVISFSENDVFYCYSSFMPNDYAIKEPPEGFVRGQTLICIQKIERRTEDACLVLTQYL